jgi:hypothetical protein
VRKILRSLVSFLTVAVIAAPLFAWNQDDLDFWIGFGTTQKGIARGPKLAPTEILGVPVVVGSNVPGGWTTQYTVRVSLTITGPNGYQCSVQKDVTAQWDKPVMPLRFQVEYPTGKLPKRDVAYALTAKVFSPNEKPSAHNNNSNSMTARFPVGGTPQCKALP